MDMPTRFQVSVVTEGKVAPGPKPKIYSCSPYYVPSAIWPSIIVNAKEVAHEMANKEEPGALNRVS